jgi:hypothetical protein
MSGVVRVVILLVAFALATIAVGWWAVPVLGGVWGLVATRSTLPALTAAAAAGLSWAALLGWAAFRGPLLGLADKVGAIVGVPAWGLVAVAVAFPALLAGSAAMLVSALRPTRK